MANINDFKSRLKGGGARANQFKVTLPFPGFAALAEKRVIWHSYVLQLIHQLQILLMLLFHLGVDPFMLLATEHLILGQQQYLNDTDFKIYRATLKDG